jgi:hypothetical protein
VIAAGREGRGRFPQEGITMTIDRDDTGFEPPHASYRPVGDEPDPRPLPADDAIAGTVASIFDALAFVLDDSLPTCVLRGCSSTLASSQRRSRSR